MDFLLSDFGVGDPLACVVLQEVKEERFKFFIVDDALDEAVIILELVGQYFHFDLDYRRVVLIANILQVVHEGFDEVFGQIFGEPFLVAHFVGVVRFFKELDPSGVGLSFWNYLLAPETVLVLNGYHLIIEPHSRHFLKGLSVVLADVVAYGNFVRA